jgi:hypothetical protein
MSELPDRRNVLATAILDRILDFYAAEQGVQLPVAVEPDIVRQALIVALASVVEVDPALQTKAQLRAERDSISRDLLLQLQTTRAHFEQTGYRGWAARNVPTN